MQKRNLLGVVLGSIVLAAPLYTYANYHLSNAATTQGVDQRGFANPVTGNPGNAAADPTTVPGEGNPNAGRERGTPSVSVGDLNPTAAGNASLGGK